MPDLPNAIDAIEEPGRKREAAPEDVSRRRLLAVAGLTAVLAAGSGVSGATAVATRRHRKGPTERVAPRPERVAEAVGTDVFWRCAPQGNQIALTFDDGPDPRWTPIVLEALADARARATFFQLGDGVRAEPSLAREVVAAGHEVASHGTGHQDLTDMSIEELRLNLGTAHDAIAEVTGIAPSLLRPPWGRIDSPGLFVAAELGYRVALWSHHLPTDGAEKKVDHNIATATPGMIMLCHDGRSTPASSLYVAVRRLLRELTDQGYEFVTVSELAAS